MPPYGSAKGRCRSRRERAKSAHYEPWGARVGRRGSRRPGRGRRSSPAGTGPHRRPDFRRTPGRSPSFFIRRLTQINADFIIVLQVRGASIQCVKICAKLRNLRISRPRSVLPHHPRPNRVATSGCTRCPGHPGWDRSVATGVDAGSNYGSVSRCRTGTDPPCAREDRWPATAFGRVPHKRSRPTLAVALTSRSSQDRCPCAWLALCQTRRWVVS